MNPSISATVIWCLLIASLLPMLPASIAKWQGFKKKPHEGGYDNGNPRAWLAQQTGYAQRANAAQLNTFEALPFFYTAVLLALFLGADLHKLGLLCIAWLVVRVIYVLLYAGNLATLRSLVWTVAVAINIWILFLAY